MEPPGATARMSKLSLLKGLWGHLRFTALEWLANARRIGALGAARFFFMRLTVPFGRPAPYFIGRRSDSPIVARIDQDGFCELPAIDRKAVDGLLGRALEQASAAGGARIATIEDYADTLRRAGVRRQTALVSDGRPGCPLASIARSPEFAGLAARYLDLPQSGLIVEATVDTLVPSDRAPRPGSYDDALEFHRDIDAYRFLKVFVYLTDCREGEGHHEVYLRSHRCFPRELIPIRRYHASEIEKAIPEAVLKKITGPAGFAFGENTLAFHRGTHPVRNHRMILNLIYTQSCFQDYYANAFPLCA